MADPNTVTMERNFTKSPGVDDSNKSPVVEYGYKGDLRSEYLITIRNQRPSTYRRPEGKNIEAIKEQTVIIRAPLQEQFGMTTEANWQPLTAAYVMSRIGNELFQALGARTAVNRYISRRIWTGTSPIDFTLNLKFQAIDNTVFEVVAPCQELQKMSLPYAAGGFLGKYMLLPPGPNPFDIKWMKDIGMRGAKRKGEITTVSIGKFLELHQVVIKRVEVKFPPKFESGGYPIEAIATVNFQTYEIETKESLGFIYNPGLRETVKSRKGSLGDPILKPNIPEGATPGT